MSTFLYRLGRGAALHPVRAIGGWLAVTAVILGLAAAFGAPTQDDWRAEGTESQAGYDLIREHVPGAGSAFARVVVHDDSAVPATILADLDERLQAMPHVVTVLDPVVSADQRTAVVTVTYDVKVTHRDLMGNLEPLEDAVAPLQEAGLQVEFNGEVPDTAAAPMRGYGEIIGLVAALFILVLAFGSIVAAGLPILTALAGLAAGAGGLTLLAGFMDVSTTAPTVATMVGLGVGIDYALLMATRHTEYLRAGYDVPEAAGRAAATAGRSVVFASMTVLVSLLGLRWAGLPTYESFGFATAITVVCVLAASLVLVPALSRFGGRRLLPRRVRRGGTTAVEHPFTARWATRIGRRPLPWALAAVFVMLALAAPLLDMRTWPNDASNSSQETTSRRATDLVTEAFGPGANTSYTVVADHRRLDHDAVAALHEELAGRDDLTLVSPVTTSPDGAVSLIELRPSFDSIDARTPQLVADLREDLPEGALLTGLTPLFDDLDAILGERLWLVIAFVVGVSVLLLTMVFRSVLVPLKAALMNLLSIGAAYGVLVAVFQWGWGVSLFGLDGPTPVSSWIPILIFAILFGLSMDYEVFLLSRVREHWLASGDARTSVVHGLRDTGRVISSAAAIMVAVFLGFATETDVIVKMLGLGLAVAVFLDATLVRMVLVPATMAMLGRLNWWMPAWLDRLLPTVDVEADEQRGRSDGDEPTTRPSDSELAPV